MPKVHFITQGCSANLADTEIMEGHVLQAGYFLTDKEEDADIIVMNSCTVKGKTETYFRKKLKQLEQKNKKVILAGCIPQSEKRRSEWANHSMIGTYQVDKIAQVVNETLEGNLVSLLQRENRPRLNLPKTRKNSVVEIVPISQGCLSACSFCKTKLARGNLYSYRPEDIVRHISKAVEDGAKEIWLTSQDNGAYGRDIGTNMVELLRKILTIPREFRVRFGMGNPDHMKDLADGIIEVFSHPKMYQFIHIPVQTGSNRVLEAMRRGYTVEDYRMLVKKLKEKLPNLTISTDLICGFPTETEEDFQETLSLVKDTKPDVINISRFWPREGTPAARMKQLPGAILKDRTRRLTELFREVALENNQKWKGWKGKVLITEQGKHDVMLGRNYAYKQVVVPGFCEIGSTREVEIADATALDLRCV
ncbi:tRNA (N(6)-L-threonylcarbamoyladenosine(37)-C(2))-methylthiotransferase [Candidatus Woesearchaeota archaeon]|nr:tRNA (N(6)-L-threonylcarbamoyladenosine(37)-C(2))-methylthiotransferase [Candidatus Woesearchaeota archaeon]